MKRYRLWITLKEAVQVALDMDKMAKDMPENYTGVR